MTSFLLSGDQLISRKTGLPPMTAIEAILLSEAMNRMSELSQKAKYRAPVSHWSDASG